MKSLLLLMMSALLGAPMAQPQSRPPQAPSDAPLPKTTEVMVILTAKQGVTRQQIMNIMPAEIRATVKLYLDGKIRQWYSRGDGRGVVLFLDVKTTDAAHTIMNVLPLSKANLVDHEFNCVAPPKTLTFLLG